MVVARGCADGGGQGDGEGVGEVEGVPVEEEVGASDGHGDGGLGAVVEGGEGVGEGVEGVSVCFLWSSLAVCFYSRFLGFAGKGGW